MKWVCISIKTKTEAVEAISYGLTEIGISSIEINDPKDITSIIKNKQKTDWDYIDEDILKNKDMEEVLIKAYIPEDNPYEEKIIQIQEKLNNIKQFLDIGKGTIEIEKIDEERWVNSWKKYYKPIKIGKNIIIKPTWEEYIPKCKDEIIVEMDPGMAFGTGTHETTSMCIEALEQFISKGDIIFDIGCGSGILGISAAKLGAKKVIGVDLDPNAVKVAKNNVKLNKVDNIMKVYEGNLLDVITEKANIVVANIIADIIIEISKNVFKFLKPKGFFISSGIIKSRLSEVKETIINNNFDIINIYEKGEWCAIIAQMKE
ncbi:50S ribosomal protein L11 methyltransferase [Defluviitalea phaphyphila]|uniref:50S ribosomal protein L11 methyltransferase n=1 Tax=Defluviitalea phaphyphila TaxID=1473580 RepID=UPI000ADA374A|nr:50S ribosomal protein L11 methyltransferase [Defluviitalea phaphyphila]